MIKKFLEWIRERPFVAEMLFWVMVISFAATTIVATVHGILALIPAPTGLVAGIGSILIIMSIAVVITKERRR
jgi:hypothetical protein